MSDDTKRMPKLGRRDSLKLATAVTALGAGLGIVLEADDANAEGVAAIFAKIKATDLGNLTVKLFKHDADGKTHTLLDTIDVGALTVKLNKGGSFSVKMYNHKLDAPVMLSELSLAVEPGKVAGVAPAPIQAPPAIKR